MQIAIDGPAGAGKSTIAKMLAESLRYIYIDTGAMYRAITHLALKIGISCEDVNRLEQLAAQAEFNLVPAGKGRQLVICNGEDVTEEIRDSLVSQKVSIVSSYPQVRYVLLKKQQDMAINRDVVMDGRDIGTVVLPEADYKLFLTASVEERARRRYNEMLNKGYTGTYEEVKKELIQRDRLDSSRAVAPLRPAADAIIIDTTDKTPEEVVIHILEYMKKD